VTYIIAQPCVDVKDKSCIEECPVDCIYEGDRMLYIQPDECVDCGACEPVCPVEAIYYEDDVIMKMMCHRSGSNTVKLTLSFLLRLDPQEEQPNLAQLVRIIK